MKQEILHPQSASDSTYETKAEDSAVSALKTVLELFPEMSSQLSNFIEKLKKENSVT